MLGRRWVLPLLFLCIPWALAALWPLLSAWPGQERFDCRQELVLWGGYLHRYAADHHGHYPRNWLHAWPNDLKPCLYDLKRSAYHDTWGCQWGDFDYYVAPDFRHFSLRCRGPHFVQAPALSDARGLTAWYHWPHLGYFWPGLSQATF